MKLKCENIGKIQHAEIDIDGITVIAGLNNTGKSTLGKSLYCIFYSLHDIENSPEKLLKEEILSIIGTKDQNSIETVDKILEFRSNIEQNKDILFQLLENIGINPPRRNILYKRIREVLLISDEDLIRKKFARKFKDEFNDQISYIGNIERKSEVSLTIKDNTTNVLFEDNKVIKIENLINLEKQPVYIDNPFILDEICSAYEFNVHTRVLRNHRIDLEKLLVDSLTSQDPGIVHELVTEQKFSEIIEKIKEVSKSELRATSSEITAVLPEMSEPLNLKNVSAGLKTFLLIKTLVDRSILEDDGTLILDEPEIHIHPEWQLKFAEIIVLLQKEYNMHILLTTHSPYFMEAIEVFSLKHNVSHRCNYYLASSIENSRTKFDKVNDRLEDVYALMAKPFDDLEKIKSEIQ